ncbi:MAG TPA: dienelactone hydrolase family protein [Caulobacteraceae bacterium]|jgi:carboxymethylenebutenolidase
MCDSEINRRAFTAASIAAGAAIGAAWGANAQAAGVKETEVSIKTPDGETDAALYTPAGKGPFPGVLIFTDIFGLRPAFRDMGKRLAGEGYTVLIPNPFYRTKKGALLTPAEQAGFNFAKDGAKLQPHTSAITADGTTKDETAWLAYLDGLQQVSKKAKLGVNGYCMGGPRVVQASAIRPDRVGAAMACHPGNGLVTDQPSSPHLLAPKIKAKTFFAIAQNDAMQKPDIADKLKAAWAAAGNPCGAEVYKANHGWCLPDGAVYNKEEAERAWKQMLVTFKEGMA